jgi:hypothetical protein
LFSLNLIFYRENNYFNLGEYGGSGLNYYGGGGGEFTNSFNQFDLMSPLGSMGISYSQFPNESKLDIDILKVSERQK